MFDYTVETKQSVEQAIQTLAKNLGEEHFGILWDLDMQATLKSKGIQYDNKYHVLEVCNPQAANQVLTKNQLAGYVLPCKIAVYEEGKTTKIGMPRPTALIQMVGDASLQDFATDIEKKLQSCINASI